MRVSGLGFRGSGYGLYGEGDMARVVGLGLGLGLGIRILIGLGLG